MLRDIVRTLKKLPLDLGQYELRHTTKGKEIAFELVGKGEGKKALDVGCRDGYYAEKLQRKGYRVVAIDIEPQHPAALKVDANAALPFQDDEFDLVWCSEVIEHLSSPASTVAEFKRVLKPGGVLVMTTPNNKLWIFRLIERLGILMARLENETHTYFFTYSDIANLVGESDLYGYFPYLFLKFRISAAATWLSPTIVCRHINDKRGRNKHLAADSSDR